MIINLTAFPFFCCTVPQPSINGDDRGDDRCAVHGVGRDAERGGHGDDVPADEQVYDARGVHGVLQVPEPEHGVRGVLLVRERLRERHDKNCPMSVAGQSRLNLRIP